MNGSHPPRHTPRTRPARALWPACATLVLVLAACSPPAGGATPTGNAGETANASPTGGQSQAANASPKESLAASPAGSGGGTIQGSLVTSGVYNATWTVFAGNNGISYSGGWGLTSDQGSAPGTGPEATIEVAGDGTITFGYFNGGIDGVTPPALVQGQSFTGTGATVDVRDFPGHPGEHMICGFTIDTNLTGADGSSLKIKGTMKVLGTFPTTIGTPIPC